MRVIIIGSGIAGLAAAIALRKVGIEVAVYERAPELREVGAGVSASGAEFLPRLSTSSVSATQSASVSLKMTQSEIRGAEQDFKIPDGVQRAANWSERPACRIIVT